MASASSYFAWYTYQQCLVTKWYPSTWNLNQTLHSFTQSRPKFAVKQSKQNYKKFSLNELDTKMENLIQLFSRKHSTVMVDTYDLMHSWVLCLIYCVYPHMKWAFFPNSSSEKWGGGTLLWHPKFNVFS